MLKMGLVAVLQERTFDALSLELEDLHGHDRRLGDIVHVGGPMAGDEGSAVASTMASAVAASSPMHSAFTLTAVSMPQIRHA